MSGTSNLWEKSILFMSVLGNIVLLQLANLALFITGIYLIVIPVIIMMSSAMIYKFIYEEQKFTIRSYIDTFKEQFKSLCVYTVVINFTYISVRYSHYMQSMIQLNNLNAGIDLALIISSTILFIFLFLVLLYYPLISVTTDQCVMTKLKVSIMMPFFSFKLLLFIVLLSIFNFLLFTNNFLFLVLLGPIPLLASNIIIFKNNINQI